jgi:RNA polymerase sigma factor (TIGR02999 family)
MPEAAPSQLTRLLEQANDGSEAALAQVVDTVYRELHRLASRVISGEQVGHTLQATALVHEAYLHLFADSPVKPKDSKHFFALAARQMRRILVDHARAKHANKRGGLKISLDDICEVSSEPSANYVALDDAMRELEEQDPEANQVIELRFFGGYTEPETAEILGVSVAKVRRDWEFARAWLFHRLDNN